MDYEQLNMELGNTELLLAEQILRGEFRPGIRILDAGCGEGRNMIYFIRNGFSIYGIDKDPEAVSMARLVARSLNRDYISENIFQSDIEENPFPAEFFDRLICINVLHAAENIEQLDRLVDSMLRLLKKDGMMYIIMESRFEAGVAEGHPGSGEPGGPPVKKLFLTRLLLERLLTQRRIGINGDIRTYRVEDKISRSGFWLKKM